LIELTQKISLVLKSKSDSAPANTTIDQLYDITNLACICIQSQSKPNSWEIDSVVLFQVLSTQICCFLEGFFHKVTQDNRKFFLEITISTLNRQFALAKQLGKTWMLFNCASYYWRLNCLMDGKIFHELWGESIYQLYETLIDPKTKNSSILVLISLIYANIQLDACSSTGKIDKKAKPENNQQFLKIAEDVLKLASTTKDCDIVTMLLLLPTWNRLQQLKPTSGANSPAITLEFEDPLLKLIVSFDSPTLKIDPAKVLSNLDVVEYNFNTLGVLDEIPTIFKMRLYYKIAKQAIEAGSYDITISIYHTILETLDNFSAKYQDKITEDILSWSFLTQLDVIVSYLNLIRSNTNIFDTAAMDLLLDFYRKICKTEVVSKHVLSTLDQAFWAYISSFAAEGKHQAFFIVLFKYVVILNRLKSNTLKFIDAFSENIKENGPEVLCNILSISISVSKIVNEGSHTTEIIEKVFNLIPYQHRGAIYAKHPELWDPLLEKSFKQKIFIPIKEKLKIAFALKAGEIKTTLINICKKAFETEETSNFEDLVGFYLESSVNGIEIEPKETVTERLKKDSIELYVADSPILLVFGIFFDSTFSDSNTSENTSFKLNACQNRLMALITQLFNNIKRKAILSEEEKKSKKDEKPPKDAKATKPASATKKKGESKAPADIEISIPTAWDNYIWPASLKTAFAEISNNTINPSTITDHTPFLSRLVQIIKLRLYRKEYTDCVPILIFLELYTEVCFPSQPIYPLMFTLIYALVQDKNHQPNVQYKKFIENSLDIDFNNAFLSLNLLGKDDSNLPLLFVDCLIYFKEFERATLLLNHMLKIGIDKNDPILDYLSRISFINCFSMSFQMSSDFAEFVIQRQDSLNDIVLQSMLCYIISKTKLSRTTSEISINLSNASQMMNNVKISVVEAKILEEWLNLELEILLNLNSMHPNQYMNRIHEFFFKIDAYDRNIKVSLLVTYFKVIINSSVPLLKIQREALKGFLLQAEAWGELSAELENSITILKCLAIFDEEYSTKELQPEFDRNIVELYLSETDPEKKQKKPLDETSFKPLSLLQKFQELQISEAYKPLCALCVALLNCMQINNDSEMEKKMLEQAQALILELSGKCRSRILCYVAEAILKGKIINQKDRFKYVLTDIDH
jgi:hypothetical protein